MDGSVGKALAKYAGKLSFGSPCTHVKNWLLWHESVTIAQTGVATTASPELMASQSSRLDACRFSQRPRLKNFGGEWLRKILIVQVWPPYNHTNPHAHIRTQAHEPTCIGTHTRAHTHIRAHTYEREKETEWGSISLSTEFI